MVLRSWRNGGYIKVIENRIHKLEEIVKPILDRYADSRVDDFILVMRVYDSMLDGNYLGNISFRNAMMNHIFLGLPPFESITRCRRKLQQMYPELRNDDIAEIRTNEKGTYIEYALDI